MHKLLLQLTTVVIAAVVHTQSVSHAEVLAQRGGAIVKSDELDLQHFLASDQRRSMLKANEGDVLRTIDEILNVRTFSLKKDPYASYTDFERAYVKLQAEKSSLASALAIEERRIRAKFRADDLLIQQRAREIWLLDTQNYFTEEEADITGIFFDLSKRGWQETRERISAALNELEKKTSFHDVLTKFTDDPNPAVNKGALKGVRARGADPSLVRPLFTDLKIGEYSQPLSTRRGIYIVRLDAKRGKEKRPFHTVKDQIIADLLEQQAKAARISLIESLQQEPITLNEPAINKLLPKPAIDPMDTIRKLHLEQGLPVSPKPQ
jgi:hypothetical protein